VTYAVALLGVLFLLVSLERLGVTRAAAKVFQTSRAGAISMRDHSLTDSEKERALRQASLALMRDFASIGVRSIGALAISLLPLLAADLTGIAEFSAVISWLATWKAIGLATVVVASWYWLRLRF
jgi:hypothetical protein